MMSSGGRSVACWNVPARRADGARPIPGGGPIRWATPTGAGGTACGGPTTPRGCAGAPIGAGSHRCRSLRQPASSSSCCSWAGRSGRSGHRCASPRPERRHHRPVGPGVGRAGLRRGGGRRRRHGTYAVDLHRPRGPRHLAGRVTAARVAAPAGTSHLDAVACGAVTRHPYAQRSGRRGAWRWCRNTMVGSRR